MIPGGLNSRNEKGKHYIFRPLLFILSFLSTYFDLHWILKAHSKSFPSKSETKIDRNKIKLIQISILKLNNRHSVFMASYSKSYRRFAVFFQPTKHTRSQFAEIWTADAVECEEKFVHYALKLNNENWKFSRLFLETYLKRILIPYHSKS